MPPPHFGMNEVRGIELDPQPAWVLLEKVPQVRRSERRCNVWDDFIYTAPLQGQTVLLCQLRTKLEGDLSLAFVCPEEFSARSQVPETNTTLILVKEQSTSFWRTRLATHCPFGDMARGIPALSESA